LEKACLDEAFRALSHSDRRLFVRACLGNSLAAGELAARSQLSNATVSEHLKVLRKSGLLVLERDGRFWRYRTDRQLLADLSVAIAELGED
jgi:DNA-binding transcriptional ArsR family regulator